MRLVICAVGRLKAGPERDLTARYAERLTATGRSLALGPLDVVEIEESRARRAEDRKAEEAHKLLAAAGGALVVALDEAGPALASEAFAARIAAWRDAGTASLAFLIGGADGHGPPVAERAALTLSFGRMTWPHQIVRILLAEQLYRAATIIAGHPYHRA
ncbi:23S rRNA (pseudouridine(1915)-N(3))-methyltransferase RlmH [Labrys wisconsinensis]|uniref:Ribosomal RNA large subunit methyltransferase H n=1 Tax=Labrys wisconsinensis TaxID=425677 RepID=A0ABU0J3W4_9HYPH|nr:23S rRNA (pseudouridine(1915)-N(3))-methyltransferase RlmH [Labrys wisconsinensis]MDQ0468226.1 23S rRNA (pseudouridine1915-N3)-methyltransferase [Labrys wisconsinensis]